MKKVQKTKRKEFIPFRFVELYREDLEDIASIFDNNRINYKLIVNDNELENISELRDLDEKAKSVFSIETITPCETLNPNQSLSFRLTRGAIYITQIPESNMILSGIASHIESIIRKRTNRLLVFLFSIKGISVVYILFSLLVGFNQLSGIYYWLSFGLLMSAFLCAIFYYGSNNCVLLLTSMHEKQNFFIKHKDQLLIGIIGSVVGSVITLVITKHF